MAGYTIKSLGCRANAADGESIDLALRHLGNSPADNPDTAEVLILNTCAVTAQAERDARAAIRRVRRRNPSTRIVVTGCYAQRAPQELAALEGVAAVVGNSHKALAVAAAAATDWASAHAGMPVQGWVSAETLGAPAVLHAPFSSRHIAGEHHGSLALPPGGAGLRTRPVLRIQEGCGNRCSFCVIPETRGPSASLPPGEVLAAVRAHVAAGVQELVLSGINLGRWGRELAPAHNLPHLLRLLLEQTAVPRLRLSSIEPMDWDDQLLALFAEYAEGDLPRLAPHAHLPLQSGSDAILRKMHRRYRPWHYADKLNQLAAMCPLAALGADIMVGFPGETDVLFEESLRFVERQPLTYLHLFPYSPRPGTPAQALHQAAPAPHGAVRERMQALQVLGRRMHRAHMQRCLGRTIAAVTLNDGRALTANFLPVVLPGPVQPNRMLAARIVSIEDDLLTAVPAPAAFIPALFE